MVSEGHNAVGEVVRVPILAPEDLYVARSEAMRFSEQLGFRSLARLHLCTAVSEIVRNVILYAETGLLVMRGSRRGLYVEVSDNGPGIPLENLAAIEAGTYRSQTGMGKGIHGCRNIMDRLSILTAPGSTQVFMEKYL